ncbi:hypothetical protein ARHIZOSPH14_08540 [Agromyces rhizosphaerae]|uniref:DUF3806 domain-containing protein n=1 Tax=Agromyces rhizosphaerae TaxID=88374 RepID=A0A9W6FQH2_9MICO|nr:DUF3806 domain-containing protein [Agromyces rhizosphaerae]GLI26612.1 hypothetical protein ARHIZOSPH14_08540 [Agromyces rhizosphaerae]
MPLFGNRSRSALPPLAELVEQEREWIDAHLDLVEGTGTDVADADQVRGLYEHWAGRWKRINPPERSDPRTRINALGVALGEHLVRCTSLEWRITTDEYRPELVVINPRSRTMLSPVQLVEQNWLAEKPGTFITEVVEVERARNPAKGRRGRP